MIVFLTPPDYETLLDDIERTSAYAANGRGRGDRMETPLMLLWVIFECTGLTTSLLASEPGSHLCHLLEKCTVLSTSDRAELLENDNELEATYKLVTVLGDTDAPDPKDEVDFHYVSFVKSCCNDELCLMDGDREGPSNEGVLPSSNLLSDQSKEVIRHFIKEHDDRGSFSLLALAPALT